MERGGYTTLSVADWDHDGRLDIVLNSIWGRVEWLRNIGTSTYPKLAPPQPIEIQWQGETPKPDWTWWNPQGKELVTQWRTTPLIYDFNHDGLVDLAMLDTEGYLAFFERTKRDETLVVLPGRRSFLDASGKPLRLNSKTAGGSGRRKLCVVDWNGDGKLDLLLNSSNADLYLGTGSIDEPWRILLMELWLKEILKDTTSAPRWSISMGIPSPIFGWSRRWSDVLLEPKTLVIVLVAIACLEPSSL